MSDGRKLVKIIAVFFSSAGFAVVSLAVAAVLALLSSPRFAGILPAAAGTAAVLIAILLLVCLLRRLRSLTLTAFLFHLGGLLFIAAGLLSADRELITVNIHQGSKVENIFAVDNSGVDLEIGGIRRDYYPVMIRLGVRKGGRKYRLMTLRTGDGFVLPGYRVMVGDFIAWQAAVELKVFAEDGSLKWQGSTPTPAAGGLPYEFILVAYQTPKISDLEVDLALDRKGEELARGIIGPNRVWSWQGYRFFCTGVSRDPYGFPYASVQISRDPGLILFYPAAIIILVAGGAALTPLGKRRLPWRRRIKS